GDLEPVFAAMLEKAVRMCDATFGNVYRWDGEALHLVATRNTPPAFAEARRRSLRRRDGGNLMLATILATKTPVHVVDAAALPGYIDRSDLAAVQTVELAGVRTLLAVPMLKEGELIGGSQYIVKKFARLPTSKSNWSRTLLLRRSSPSRTRGCSTNCATERERLNT